jgi:hypothetical protein
MGWDGMGWDGMGWDGMGWDGMGGAGPGRAGLGWPGLGLSWLATLCCVFIKFNFQTSGFVVIFFPSSLILYCALVMRVKLIVSDWQSFCRNRFLGFYLGSAGK